MPDLYIPEDYLFLSFEIRNSASPKPAIVTSGAHVSTPPFTQSNLAALWTDLTNAMKPVHPNTITYTKLVAIIGTGGIPGRLEVIGSVAGTHTTTALAPPQVSALWKKNTNLSGRKYRGRMYVPYIPEGQIDEGGKISTAELAIHDTAAAAWKAALEDSVGNNLDGMYLLHVLEIPGSSNPTVVVDLSPQLIVATQRRRLDRSA